jgi:hypothetical protein
MTVLNNPAGGDSPKLDANGNAIPAAPVAAPQGEMQFDEQGELILKSGDSDPLDVIEDETLRADAKKNRAILNRLKRQGKVDAEGNPVSVVPAPVVEAPAAPAAATKYDLKLMTLNAARKLVPQEVADVWNELKEVPLGGFDPLDADSIATNMI